MDRFRQDLIISLRHLRRRPGFAAAAIVTLALGLGANTVVFTAVNAMLFRSMGVERPDELVSLNSRTRTAEVPTLSFPNYRDYRDRNDVLAGLASYTFEGASLSQGGTNQILFGYLATGNYFDLLGVQPALGRLFLKEDDVKKGGHPVVVISYNSWQKRFGGEASVVGKNVLLDGHNFTVIGVASVLGAFGLLAAALAATGVYGMMAYAVARRSREIGIRMALGAMGHQGLRAVLGRAATLVAAGGAAGIAMALAGGSLFSVVLYGISAHDPLTFACALALMGVVALGACWLPARRAITVDPAIVLRAE
jgi:ABC-type lipoprotein release transport system permease subunit